MSLTGRIAALEAESNIRRLKARYLNACDRKDVQTIRDCFTPDAVIEFPPLGTFDIDGLVNIFTEMAVKTNIIDSHQGYNAEITVTGKKAVGIWGLTYSVFNPDDQSFRLLTGFYHDEYSRVDGEWLISASRSAPRRIFDGRLNNDNIKAQFLGD